MSDGVEQLMEEEEYLEQKGKVERQKAEIENQRMLAKLRHSQGKDALRAYKRDSGGKNYDWEQMKMRVGGSGQSRSIVAVPRGINDG